MCRYSAAWYMLFKGWCWNEKSTEIMMGPVETMYSSSCFGFQTPQILIYSSETCIPDASFWNHPTYGVRICLVNLRAIPKRTL
jgi:hypothetical protein